eukprot:3348291-Prymnesium_polylepis.2
MERGETEERGQFQSCNQSSAAKLAITRLAPLAPDPVCARGSIGQHAPRIPAPLVESACEEDCRVASACGCAAQSAPCAPTLVASRAFTCLEGLAARIRGEEGCCASDEQGCDAAAASPASSCDAVLDRLASATRRAGSRCSSTCASRLVVRLADLEAPAK